MLSGELPTENNTQGPLANSFTETAAIAREEGTAAMADSIPEPPSIPHLSDDEDEAGEDETKALLRVWLNERAAPVLLPYATVTIGNILELLANQMALLVEQRGDAANAAYVSCLYQMEIERLKFMVTSYLKCRLRKVSP